MFTYRFHTFYWIETSAKGDANDIDFNVCYFY